MQLLNEIIEAATDPKTSVADTLRKCIVLAFELKNEQLKTWAEAELNGYNKNNSVPEYRKLNLHSTGNFQGPFGAWIPGRPLPMAALEEKDRKYLVPTVLSAPIAAYEANLAQSENKGSFSINWPPDLIARYQGKYMDGYVLAQAWQELPPSALTAIVDTVKNKMLRFALELRDEVGAAGDKPQDVPREKIDRAVTNIIFGGTNIIAGTAKDFTQIGSIHIAKGDLGAMADALGTLGIEQSQIAEATNTILKDGKPAAGELGPSVKSWLGTIGEKLGSAGLKIGTGAATQLVTEWILQYWGLK
jgi:hypothetical protein